MKSIIYGLAMLTLISCGETNVNTVPVNETATQFVTRYVENADSEILLSDYSKYWYAKARKFLLDTELRTRNERDKAAHIHKLILSDGALASTPIINEWNDTQQTISFDYKLNKPIPLETMNHLFEVPLSDTSQWDGYQITVEKEAGQWVVSGESITGTGL